MSQEITKEDLSLLRDLRDKIADIEEKIGVSAVREAPLYPAEYDIWFCEDCFCHFTEAGSAMRHIGVGAKGKSTTACFSKGVVKYSGKKLLVLMEDHRGNPVTRFEGQRLAKGKNVMTADDIREHNAKGSLVGRKSQGAISG